MVKTEKVWQRKFLAVAVSAAACFVVSAEGSIQ